MIVTIMAKKVWNNEKKEEKTSTTMTSTATAAVAVTAILYYVCTHVHFPSSGNEVHVLLFVSIKHDILYKWF